MDKYLLQQRTKKYAIACIKLCEKFPASKITDVIIYQLVKSATSVGANYRAACRAKSKADFINKLKIVEEEADESMYWIELLGELGYLKGVVFEKAIKESKELVAIFTSAVKTSKST